MQPPSDQIISVKAFVDILNETLGFAFPSVTVEGEISRISPWNQYLYITLKEEDTVLECFMVAAQLKVPLEEGMKVRVTGFPKLTGKGKFSFTVRSVELAGEGELKRAFELLKAKLQKEGLFEEARKRPLPRFPRSIGLITSARSAAYADFTKILSGRWGGLEIQLADVQVQGAAAPDQIVGAIEYFNQLAAPPDVLVIIRGGGSLEDLQAFNTEPVARAIAGSRAPTVVGVGHEVDFSLADFASDRRAATPTDAARIVIPDRTEVRQTVVNYEGRWYRSLRQHLQQYQHAVIRQMTILERFIRLPRTRLEAIESRLVSAQKQGFALYGQRLSSLTRLMSSFDPRATLKRGYAIVRSEQRVITKATQVSAGNSLMIQLGEGNISSTVDKIEQNR